MSHGGGTCALPVSVSHAIIIFNRKLNTNLPIELASTYSQVGCQMFI